MIVFLFPYTLSSSSHCDCFSFFLFPSFSLLLYSIIFLFIVCLFFFPLFLPFPLSLPFFLALLFVMLVVVYLLFFFSSTFRVSLLFSSLFSLLFFCFFFYSSCLFSCLFSFFFYTRLHPPFYTRFHPLLCVFSFLFLLSLILFELQRHETRDFSHHTAKTWCCFPLQNGGRLLFDMACVFFPHLTRTLAPLSHRFLIIQLLILHLLIIFRFVFHLLIIFPFIFHLSMFFPFIFHLSISFSPPKVMKNSLTL
jgi:hypothetical protein